MIQVRPVQGRGDFRTFLRLPWSIYRGDPSWVPPLLMDVKSTLDTRRNPFYAHAEIQLFLAFRDGRPAGRIASVVDSNYVSFQEDRAGFFGFFESVDDPAVAAALLDAAAGWLRERGMERVIGPANPSTNHVLGMLVDAFDRPPMVMMPYNPPCYPALCEGWGLAKVRDLYAYLAEATRPPTEKIQRVAALVQKRNNVTVRSADTRHFDRELELVKTAYNDAWERNWGFVPWTDQEIEHLGRDIKTIADPKLVLLAFVDGEIAGFSLSLPNINQALKHVKSGRLFPLGLLKLLWHSRRIDEIRVAVMGVRRKFRGLGIEAVFYNETYFRATRDGIRRAELSWVLEDNYSMRNVAERWGVPQYKTYRVYQRDL